MNQVEQAIKQLREALDAAIRDGQYTPILFKTTNGNLSRYARIDTPSEPIEVSLDRSGYYVAQLKLFSGNVSEETKAAFEAIRNQERVLINKSIKEAER